MFLQFGDGVGDLNSGLVIGIDPERQEVAGLSCAQVLAEVMAQGFTLQELKTIGINDSTGIWYWQRQQ